MMRWFPILACVVLGLLAGAPQRAGAGETYLMPVPVSPTNAPLNDAEKERIKTQGRDLPKPEVLQPRLDPGLAPYRAPTKPIAGTFRVASSDVLPLLVKSWISAFAARAPKVRIVLEPPYAGSLGAKELVAGGIDGVFVSRELRPDDIKEFQAKYGYAPTSIPIAGGTYRHYGFLDAVAVIVHRDNPLNAIDYTALDALLSTTRHRGGAPVRTWGDLGLTGDWADKPINVHAIKPWNGFEEFVRQRVLGTPGKRGEWREDLSFAPVVFPIAREVAGDRYALGYTGMAYLDAPVKVLALREDGDHEAVAPSYEAVATARYPLSRLVFFNVNRKPGEALTPALAEFIRFILSADGQKLVLDQGVFLPLTGDQAGQGRAAIE